MRSRGVIADKNCFQRAPTRTALSLLLQVLLSDFFHHSEQNHESAETKTRPRDERVVHSTDRSDGRQWKRKGWTRRKAFFIRKRRPAGRSERHGIENGADVHRRRPYGVLDALFLAIYVIHGYGQSRCCASQHPCWIQGDLCHDHFCLEQFWLCVEPL